MKSSIAAPMAQYEMRNMFDVFEQKSLRPPVLVEADFVIPGRSCVFSFMAAIALPCSVLVLGDIMFSVQFMTCL